MSWPDLACASAAPVSSSLLPCEVMKSMLTSTFSLAAHSSIKALVALLALGTQWSHNASVSLPAAWAPRTNGAATKAADATAVPATNRRRAIFDEAMFFLPEPDPRWDLGGDATITSAPGNDIQLSDTQ